MYDLVEPSLKGRLPFELFNLMVDCYEGILGHLLSILRRTNGFEAKVVDQSLVALHQLVIPLDLIWKLVLAQCYEISV